LKLGTSIADIRRLDNLLRQVEIDLKSTLDKKQQLQGEREQLKIQEQAIESRLMVELMRHRQGVCTETEHREVTKEAECEQCGSRICVTGKLDWQEGSGQPTINLGISGATWKEPHGGHEEETGSQGHRKRQRSNDAADAADAPDAPDADAAADAEV